MSGVSARDGGVRERFGSRGTGLMRGHLDGSGYGYPSVQEDGMVYSLEKGRLLFRTEDDEGAPMSGGPPIEAEDDEVSGIGLQSLNIKMNARANSSPSAVSRPPLGKRLSPTQGLAITPATSEPCEMGRPDTYPLVLISPDAKAHLCLGLIGKSGRFCLEDAVDCTVATHRTRKANVEVDCYYVDVSSSGKGSALVQPSAPRSLLESTSLGRSHLDSYHPIPTWNLFLFL